MKQIGSSNIIFVISQPRSGSSLLQHLLGSHTRIHTLPEPWFMLSLLQGKIDPAKIDAEFNAEYASIALNDFLSSIPDGKKVYKKSLRKAAISVYEKALCGRKADIFLDKTPRYYHIIPQIKELLPNARFIFLVRNPISVFSSILETNFNGDWERLFSQPDRLHDIFSGPKCIAQAINKYSGECVVTNYETIVQSTQKEIERICEKIDLEFEDNMTNYAGGPKFSDTTFVDPKSVYNHDKPVEDYIDSWRNSLDTPEKSYLGLRYLKELGPELVQKLGYDYSKLLRQVKGIHDREKYIFVNWDLVKKSPEKMSIYEQVKWETLLSIQGRGLRGTLKSLLSKIFDIL